MSSKRPRRSRQPGKRRRSKLRVDARNGLCFLKYGTRMRDGHPVCRVLMPTNLYVEKDQVNTPDY